MLTKTESEIRFICIVHESKIKFSNDYVIHRWLDAENSLIFTRSLEVNLDNSKSLRKQQCFTALVSHFYALTITTFSKIKKEN